ncbi:TPA: hypothetical protein ACG7BJ_003881, partial [Escherichia coli]
LKNMAVWSGLARLTEPWSAHSAFLWGDDQPGFRVPGWSFFHDAAGMAGFLLMWFRDYPGRFSDLIRSRA